MHRTKRDKKHDLLVTFHMYLRVAQTIREKKRKPFTQTIIDACKSR